MGWKILGIILVIAIKLYMASYFGDRAQKKGYDGTVYFWVCFLLGTLGCCIVAVLPDVYLQRQLDELKKRIDQFKNTSSDSCREAGGSWVCHNCKTENSINYGQCKKCGQYRSYDV